MDKSGSLSGFKIAGELKPKYTPLAQVIMAFSREKIVKQLQFRRLYGILVESSTIFVITNQDEFFLIPKIIIKNSNPARIAVMMVMKIRPEKNIGRHKLPLLFRKDIL